jgi:hypothetical protein
MKLYLFTTGLAIFMLSACHKSGQRVTTGSLINEMTDLSRLSQVPGQTYRTVQYSSYDRRSTKAGDGFWFANEDGFGNEPIPGFEKVLIQPDTNGIGEYLICDIQKPGAIVRLWTAGIKGRIRFFLDDMSVPVYEGLATDFFWKTLEALSGNAVKMDSLQAFRQFDAVYFPVPFARGCRIEWIGNIQEIHFYHVGVRIYDDDVNVETFSARDFIKYAKELEKTNRDLQFPSEMMADWKSPDHPVEVVVPAFSTREIFSARRSKAIERISMKIKAQDYEDVLRKSVIRIYFDHSSTPQAEAPLGDFFGAAPGINPYQSIPFAVLSDSIFVCRFLMPFQHSARISVENHSAETIGISGEIRTKTHMWEEGKTMHFYCRWKINHDLTASNINDGNSEISDILYLKASGRGRIVGAAAFIYNPSNVPTSWGNWWGEGDEKIFIDKDTFPSFFGTGSEDYFNYSWSSSRLFSYSYCGQPRNDGPGNRGYVSNFRWHILDDIPFKEQAAFTMELGHHGTVPGFCYGRIVYFYALPGLIDDHPEVTMEDLREIAYPTWKPEAYCGSAGFKFIQAESLANHPSGITTEPGKMWADGNILMWRPEHKGEKITLQIFLDRTAEKTKIGFTLAHGPPGGKISILINGEPTALDGYQTIDLYEPNLHVLVNHFSEPVQLKEGNNEITFISESTEKHKDVGIDFIWIKEH